MEGGFFASARPCEQPARSLSAFERSIGSVATLAPAIAVAILPKCPVCFLAYVGAFAALGVDMTALAGYATYLLPIACVCLSGAVLAVLYQALRTRVRGPAVLCGTGAAVLLAGRLLLDSALLIGVGLCALVISLLWARQGRVAAASPLKNQHHCHRNPSSP